MLIINKAIFHRIRCKFNLSYHSKTNPKGCLFREGSTVLFKDFLEVSAQTLHDQESILLVSLLVLAITQELRHSQVALFLHLCPLNNCSSQEHRAWHWQCELWSAVARVFFFLERYLLPTGNCSEKTLCSWGDVKNSDSTVLMLLTHWALKPQWQLILQTHWELKSQCHSGCCC